MKFADRTLELKQIETLRGHTDRVWYIAWNPATGVDGVSAMIASCGADKKVLIWEQNTATGYFQLKEVLLLHTSTVIWCAWVASGSLLATSSIDGCTRIWKSFEGSFSIINGFERCDKLPVSVSLNASGVLIATCVPRKTIWIWKIATIFSKLEYVSKVADSTKCVKMIQWHPLKDILFSCGFDNTIKIWVPDADMVNWECMQTLGESNSGCKHTIRALTFNGRANKIIACSGDLTINIWSVDVEKMRYGERNAPGTHLCTLTGHHDQTIFCVHWSREEIICTRAADGAICFFIENEDGSDNSRLAAASDDGTIKIWELASHYTTVNSIDLL